MVSGLQIVCARVGKQLASFSVSPLSTALQRTQAYNMHAWLSTSSTENFSLLTPHYRSCKRCITTNKRESGQYLSCSFEVVSTIFGSRGVFSCRIYYIPGTIKPPGFPCPRITYTPARLWHLRSIESYYTKHIAAVGKILSTPTTERPPKTSDAKHKAIFCDILRSVQRM